jgi:hypothetical protein
MEFSAIAKDLRVDNLSLITAGQIVAEHHYLHRKPAHCSHSFGLYKGAFIAGVTMFGPPIARQLQVSMLPENPDRVIECSRIWVQEGMPTNSTSWFVAECLKRLPRFIIVSYSDTSVGHQGIIYRALNFHYAGSTKPTVRTTTANGAHSRHNSDRNIGMAKSLEYSGVKHRYWTVTGNKRERAQLRKACRWAILDWRNPITVLSPSRFKLKLLT